MKQKLTNAKTRVRTIAPILGGIVLGVAAGVALTSEYYHPRAKVGIQFPPGVLDDMKATGRGLAISSNKGWFTLHYHSQDPIQR